MAKNIYNTNEALALRALYHARFYQKSLEVQQNKLLKLNKELHEGVSLDISGEALDKKVNQDLGQDLEYTRELTEAIKKVTSEKKVAFHSAVSSHKMQEILDGAKEIFSKEGNIAKIASGTLPNGYDNTTSTLTYHDCGQYYGSSASSFISACIMSTYFTMGKKNINCVDNIKSAITHAYPIQKDLITLPEEYRFKYSKDFDGLGTIHSGYAYGGGLRFLNNVYPDGKLLAPEDCGSFLDRLINPKQILSTADQLCIYRSKVGGYVPKEWYNTPPATISNSYQAVVKPEDIKVGDIYVYRRFQDATKISDTIGNSGHTALIIGLPDKDGMVKTISAARNMPSYEGVGIQDFRIIPEDSDKQVVILRVNDDYMSSEFPINFSGAQYDSYKDLSNVIQYFDELIGDSLDSTFV